MLTDVQNRLNYYGLVMRGDTIKKAHIWVTECA